jgi:hypothetical protein
MESAGLLLSRQGPCGLPSSLCCQIPTNAAAVQFSEATWTVLPLFPGDGAQPSPEPRVE